MTLFTTQIRPARLTLRVLSHVLRYPDSVFREHAEEMRQAMQAEAVLSPQRLVEMEALLTHFELEPALTAESDYVELFDRGRSTALHLFEHVHGDSRDRGPAMVDLIQTYEKAGVFLNPQELPDYLPVLLEFASTQPGPLAREFLGEIAHIVRVIFSALLARHSPYASALAAVLEIAGEKVDAVALAPEPSVDESWAEPEVFGGCSTAGQAKPGQPQPIQFVKQRPSQSLGAEP